MKDKKNSPQMAQMAQIFTDYKEILVQKSV
jgi:hypothetical protein